MDVMANATLLDASPEDLPAAVARQPVYVLITLALVLGLAGLAGCLLALILYFRRRTRLDDLRHRLVPLYTYDPAEQEEDWGDQGNEEEGLMESLLRDRQLVFHKDI